MRLIGFDRARWLWMAGLLASRLQAAPEDRSPADKDGRVRAQLTARNEVVLSSELSARIDSLPLREGDAFRAGQALVGFDCTLFKAQLNKAQSTLDAARQTLAVNQRLGELNSIGKLEVELTEARVKESSAEAAYMQATVSKCVIAAPYAGRVVKRLAAAFQFVTPGTALLAIQDTEALEIRMIMPSKWIVRLRPGTRFTLQIEELGRSYPARVLRTGARIDPVSQSMDVIGTVEGKPPALLPGMSGWAMFDDSPPTS